MRKTSLVFILTLILINTPLAFSLGDTLSINIKVAPGNGRSGTETKTVSKSSQFSAGGTTYTANLYSHLDLIYTVSAPSLASAWATLTATASGSYTISQQLVTLSATSATGVNGGLIKFTSGIGEIPPYFDLQAYAGPTILSAGSATASTEQAYAYAYDYPLAGDKQDAKTATASFSIPTPKKTFTITLGAMILANTNCSVYGIVKLTGSPGQLGAQLSFSGPPSTNVFTVQLAENTIFSINAPATITLTVVASDQPINCLWSYFNASNSSSATCSSKTYYTGVYNLTLQYSFTGSPQYLLQVFAVTPAGVKRTIFSSQVPASGSVAVKNIELYNERIEVTAYAQKGFGASNYVKVTLSAAWTATGYFIYWLVNGAKVLSATLSGSLNTNLQISAVYSLRGNNSTAYILPGMDFLPTNGTHFQQIKPGVYSIVTNASVVAVDPSSNRLIIFNGVNGTLLVGNPFGETVAIGSKSNKIRTPSPSLPQLLINNTRYYLLSIAAPDAPNITVFLKLNSSFFFARTIVPKIRILSIQYSKTSLSIRFNTNLNWENYNVTAQAGHVIASVPASQGLLVIDYSRLQNITRLSSIEIFATWGGMLIIPETRLELPVVPVTFTLIFNQSGTNIKLYAEGPLVLGENLTLSKILASLNETSCLGSLYIRVLSRKNLSTLWETIVPYPFQAEIPFFNPVSQMIEVVYIPCQTSKVVLVPWIERL
ncbi:MAG: hypothetical protein ABWK01_03165 [Infirmifilum sp.]